MAAKNQKSSTLPSNLRHGVVHTEESEGFFTKLKKKLKLKKGKYHVDVNTGECENISAVSFKKRESREVSDDECPWKLRDPKSEELSPNLSKKGPGRQSERVTVGFKVKERKYSNPETSFIRPQNLGNNDLNDFQRSSLGSRTQATKFTNEYSPLTYDTKDGGSERSRKIRESSIANECVLQDDSAVDLDCESDNFNRPNVLEDVNYDLGYEKLPERGSKSTKSLQETPSTPDFDPNYESVEEVKSRLKSSKSKDRVDFDPNYESVDEVKSQIRKSGLISPSQDEYGYQSINNLKKETQHLEENNAIRPPKTYNVNQSIESLDEPGYESLNDVKKRIGDKNFKKSVGNGKVVQKDHEAMPDTMDDMTDSAVGSVPNTGSLSLCDLSRKRSKSGDDPMAKSDGGQGLLAFTQMAVSLTGFAQALTESGRSKDSGFDSKEKNINMEQEESSKVSLKKKEHVDPMYSTVNKSKTKSVSSAGPENVPSKTVQESNVDGYDSDLELMLDPGYAECADAIKGVIPGFSIYSDGSGSKISSCTSLDLSAEDFVLEPGYAECADAIKTGAIKKISVSHERLIDQSDHSSEIYANPQILFRKRSKLLEEGKEDSGERSLAERDSDLVKEHEICLALENKQKKKEKKNKKPKEQEKPSEAPPLPARNYSLYLDNDEAEKAVKEVLDDIATDGQIDDFVLDDAFDIIDSETVRQKDTSTENKENSVVNKIEPSIACPIDKTVECSDIEPKKCIEYGKDLNETVSIGRTCATNTSSNQLISNSSGSETRESDSFNDALCDNCKMKTTDPDKDTPNCVVKGNDKSDLTGFCAEYQEDLDSEKHNSENKVEKSDVVAKNSKEVEDIEPSDDVLHVTVAGESGLRTVLTVLEKQESVTLKKKREVGKKKMSHSPEERISESNDALGKCEDDPNCDSSKTVISKEIKDYLVGEGCGNNSVHKCENDNANSSCENNDNSNTKLEDNQKSTVGCDTDDNKSKCNSYKQDNVGNTSNKTYQPNTSSMSTNDNTAVFVDTNNFLSVAVKMKTISIDSDSDLFNTDDLPKLEIHESDLDSAFDSSDNSTNLDIGTESAGIDKLTERLNTEASPTLKEPEMLAEVETENGNMAENDSLEVSEVNISISNNEVSSPVVQVNDVEHTEEVLPKEDEVTDPTKETVHDASGTSLADQTNLQTMIGTKSDVQHLNSNFYAQSVTQENDRLKDDFEKSFNENKLDITDSNSTLQSELYVVERGDNQKADVTNVMDYPEVAQCSVHANDNYSCHVGAIKCDSEDDIDGKRAEVDPSDQKEVMHLIYEKEHPNLYEDDEPTHMSIQEVLDIKSNNMASFSDPFFMHNIPNDYSSIESESVAPPPRVPRPPSSSSSSQSNNKVCFSSHVEIPADNKAVLLRLCDSSHAEDGSPPVVPPRRPIRERNARSSKRPVSYSQDFMESFRQLKDCGWYWGPLSWEEAELKLAKKPEGTFLVRDSSDEHYILSLSFKNQGRVHHTRIEHHKGHFSFWSQPDSHGKSTIKEFIDQCVENSRNGRFLYFIRPSGPGSPPMPIQLLHPVSRFIQMRSLQHMCRFRILQLVRRDHIDLLPVPKRIKQYLNEAQYYVEYLDD